MEETLHRATSTANPAVGTSTKNVSAAPQQPVTEVLCKKETRKMTENVIRHRQYINLKETRSVEIISLMDDSIDYLSTIQRNEARTVREWAKIGFQQLKAEHGYSMLVRVSEENEVHTILFDTGSSPEGAVTNAKRMRINLSEVECIVLSHGHYDHFGGLPAAIKAINKDKLPVIVHEDAFKKRGVANSEGKVRKYPDFPGEKKIKPAKYVKIRNAYPIAESLIGVTGEIPRKTSFEKGYPQHRALINNEWLPDPWILDDCALVLNIKRKGLVILSGCAHAGIINTVLYARELTGVNTIYAVLGGFHLAGKEFEPRIGQTVEAIKKLNPKIIVPSHCTGWRAKCAIAEAMPGAFVWNSVGNLYRF